MNINNVGYSQPMYARPALVNQEMKMGQATNSKDTELSHASVAKDVSDVEAVNQETKTEGKTSDSSTVKAFTYGALGMDHPDKVKSNDDGAYTAGQVLSALGTIGAILSIVV